MGAVGIGGFEPPTSCSQSRRDNRTTLYPENSDPDRIRTYDPQLRRLLLYPTELRDQMEESEGFEPPDRETSDFQDRCDKPDSANSPWINSIFQRAKKNRDFLKVPVLYKMFFILAQDLR
jgi:hypothetical protein